MNNFIKIASDIDIRPLLAELSKADPQIWKEDTYLRDYPQGPFGDTQSIILRFPPRSVKETEAALKEHMSKVDEHENVWQECSKMFPEAKKIVYELAYKTGATRIGRVMINQLKDDGTIYRHADTPSHAWYWCRFHVVVGAMPGVDFECGGEHAEMQTGEVWFFRNEFPHEVHNSSGYPRIHMIVDLKIEEVKPGMYKPLEITADLLGAAMSGELL